MLSYLKGDIELTPWHLAPLMPESKEILTSLEKLNQAGFVTYNSQPGEAYSITRNGRQKAYVDGLVTSENAEHLVEHFSALGQYRIFTKPNTDFSPNRPYTYPVTQDSFGRNFTHGPSNKVANAIEFFDSDEFLEDAWSLLSSLVTVNITDTRWGKNELWNEILVALA